MPLVGSHDLEAASVTIALRSGCITQRRQGRGASHVTPWRIDTQGRPSQCGRVLQHLSMLTLKTALILSRSSCRQGSALALVVGDEYIHSRCREHCGMRVCAAVSTAPKPGMHGIALSTQAARVLLIYIHACFVAIHAVVRVYGCLADCVKERSHSVLRALCV